MLSACTAFHFQLCTQVPVQARCIECVAKMPTSWLSCCPVSSSFEPGALCCTGSAEKGWNQLEMPLCLPASSCPAPASAGCLARQGNAALCCIPLLLCEAAPCRRGASRSSPGSAFPCPHSPQERGSWPREESRRTRIGAAGRSTGRVCHLENVCSVTGAHIRPGDRGQQLDPPQILMGASSSNKFGCEMNISRD